MGKLDLGICQLRVLSNRVSKIVFAWGCYIMRATFLHSILNLNNGKHLLQRVYEGVSHGGFIKTEALYS